MTNLNEKLERICVYLETKPTRFCSVCDGKKYHCFDYTPKTEPIIENQINKTYNLANCDNEGTK